MPDISKGTVIVPVRVARHINEQLEKLVKSNKFPSKSEIIRNAITEYLANHKADFKEILP